MDFNSLAFLGFFAVAAILTYCFPRKAKPYFLLLASYAFYLYKPQNAKLVALLISATVITYCCGILLEKAANKHARIAVLSLSLAGCLGILFYFKYFSFFNQTLHDLVGIFGGSIKVAQLDLIAPLGLSYFTFQSLGYVIDVYKKRVTAVYNPVKYALFVSFFPCIFTGPIERADHLIPQFDAPKKFNYSRMAGGAFRMLWGYFKKMVLADTIGLFVSTVYGAPAKSLGPYLVLASLLFSYQLYLDFSGCCDIAIGGARILGFTLMENFDRPFAATSYSDLWRRWHISLSSWFRDYLYIPMGGSRCPRWRQVINLMVTFLASGLWHGANLGYVIWGALNGVLLVIGKLTGKARAKLNEKNPLAKVPFLLHFFQRVWVYLCFTLCIVFFAAALYGSSAGDVFSGMLTGWAGFTWAGFTAGLASRSLSLTTIGLLTLGCCFVELVEWRGCVSSWIRRQWFIIRWPIYYALALAILFFGVFGKSAFIYQNY